MGNFHPHGDSSIYDAMVRMAQPWSLRYPMVDGQGNFGSMDGDPPAAMRYTEARLKKISDEILSDLDKETVDFQNNFDDTTKEPTVLPTRIPTLLVNGSSGIAVGMATNMAPHNLGESIDACVAFIDHHGDIDAAGLAHYVKAPDFPTGGLIYGYAGVKEAFETGRGRIVIRSRCEIEEHNNHERIIVTEIPYQVNKSELVKSIADLITEKKIEGISGISDESNRKGIRIVIDIKRDANSGVVLNKLYKMTALQSSFSVNNIALVKGRPQLLNLRDLISLFIEHRHDVVWREVGHVDVSQSGEAGEEKEITDELKARNRQLLVGYPQDLLVGKEASIHWDEVEVEITKGILEEIASLEGIDGDSPQGLHLLDDGVVGTQSHCREV